MESKYDDSWETQFGDLPKGPFVFQGKIVDPAMMGNMTYAYLGRAINDMDIKGLDFPATIVFSRTGLIAGGGMVETKGTGGPTLLSPLLPNMGEAPEDVKMLNKGFKWYDEQSDKYEIMENR